MLGLVCTAAALLGYAVMTLSPVENAHLSVRGVSGFVRSNLENGVLAGGLVTGPVFGWLGQRWRTRRSWLGAFVTAAAVCLEPLARIPAGREIRFRTVWVVEVAVGLAMIAYVASSAFVRRPRAPLRPRARA